MQVRLPILLLLCCSTAACVSTKVDDGSAEEKRPGFFSRVVSTLNPFDSDDTGDGSTATAPKWKQLELSMKLEPLPLKLPETRLLKVTLQLANTSKKFVQLEFPTAQRIEVLVRTEDGKLVEQWSQDQAFATEPTLVLINPGERLEYTVSVATRDMVPGKKYVIEGFFPNFEPLRVQQSIIPER